MPPATTPLNASGVLRDPGDQERYPLDWIDAYVARLRGFVHVREADRLLIKVPNEAYKLNDAGVHLLKFLIEGGTVDEILEAHHRAPDVRRDLYEFFIGLKQILQGCVNEYHLPDSISRNTFELGFCSLPVLSEVALTYRCNLRCKFCYAGCSSCRADGGEPDMSTEEAREILRIIREEAQTPSVSFTGGEPTLRQDLPELVRHATDQLDMRVNLITNGVRIDEALAARLKQAGLKSAQISLEAPLAAIHDSITQTPGSFDRSLAGLRHLRHQGIHVHTNTTISRENADSIMAMPAFVKSLGLDRFSMNLIIPCGSSVEAHPDLNLRYEEVAPLLVQIKDQAAAANIEFMWYSPTPVCIFNPIAHQLGNKGCAACDGLLSVSPTGDVLPCSSWRESVGNLLTDGFEKSWAGKRARWIRAKRFAPDTCAACPDFALCQSGCPLYWQYFGLEELKQHGERYVVAST